VTKDNYRGFGSLAAIFIAIGVVYALLRGDGIFFGALAGALLFGLRSRPMPASPALTPSWCAIYCGTRTSR